MRGKILEHQVEIYRMDLEYYSLIDIFIIAYLYYHQFSAKINGFAWELNPQNRCSVEGLIEGKRIASFFFLSFLSFFFFKKNKQINNLLNK